MGDEWELHYYPLAGRGEFIRLVMEEVGIQYKEINDVKHLREDLVGGRMEGYPAFAPPVIKKGDFVLSQTPVICEYLGQTYGLYPENPDDVWHAKAVNTTIHDLIAEGRLVFHGRGFIESYYTQKEETQPYIDWFLAERLQRWLSYLERALVANNGGDGFVVGNKITYVDLALLHVLRAAESQFPEGWKKTKDIPKLRAFKDRLSARPRLAAYFKSDRCKPFEGNSMM